MRISVIGTGYLGAVHAAGMAELGFDVVGVDVDQAKIDSLAQAKMPFYEPHFEPMLERHVGNRLTFTTDFAAVADADVHFVCVGTPQQRGSLAADMTYVDAAVDAIIPHLKDGALVVGKSTVPVGTAERLAERIENLTPDSVKAELAWNPEFLREGLAVQDTLHPDRLVLGVSSEHSEQILRRVYERTITQDGTPVVVTDLPTAELVKVAANSFLATKISFINAMSEICEITGADVTKLADAIGYDERIGRKFLNAGVGFGGGCLPKDIRALQTRVGELGLDHTMRFLDEMDQINLRRRDKVVTLAEQILDADLAGKRIAVLGVAFKPLSDDVRDSPGLDVAVRLFSSGADVAVYDPESNKNAAKRFPRLGYVDSLTEAVTGADLVVLTTEWNEFKALTPSDLEGLVAKKQLIDARNVLSAEEWEGAGWRFAQLGRYFNDA